jgi:PAS domain S-box-containing protein
MPMGDGGFQAMPMTDQQLAPYATSAQPAWLWSTDGSRILWCNPAGAAVLALGDRGRLGKPLSPANPHRREVAQLARRIGPGAAQRLERLRGFGARLGQLTTCACSQLTMANGEKAILLVRLEPFVGATTIVTTAQPLTANDAVSRTELAPDAAPLPRAPNEGACNGGDVDQNTLLPQVEIAAPRIEAADFPQAVDAGVDRSPDVVPTTDPPQNPLRFVWQIDAEERFSLAPGEFLRVAGARTAALQARPWSEVARALDLDSHGRIAEAIGRGETFSGIVALWPLDQQTRGRVELSGMPIFDAARNFAGYRGFGIYRQTALPSDDCEPAVEQSAPDPTHPSTSASVTASDAPDTLSQPETEIVEPPQNVVPFPLANETRMPSLSAVENHAFDEIARRLTEKFDEPGVQRQKGAPEADEMTSRRASVRADERAEPEKAEQPAWLAEAATPARGDSGRDRALLDLIPSGILIYRLDRLLYANRTFLDRTGFESLHTLQEAGGLDALYVEPGPVSASSASDEGMPLTIAHSADDRAPSAARLFSIVWDGDAAHALILQGAQAAAPVAAAAPAPAVAPSEPAPRAAVAPAGSYEAILETATDGIVLFDRSGAIISSNRSAQALFGMGANEMRALNFADLFTAESQRVVLDYFESLDGPLEMEARDHGREVSGRKRTGGLAPLSMTMGRTDGDRFFAVFRDLSQLKKSETDLLNARRNAERAATAKADALARISREIRDPLNSIIGFANIMTEERFGLLGNDRYAAYLKDIRAAGERAIAVLDDVVNISSIESGHHNLKLVSQNLNDMVEQCVGVLQPQANRERVIIRTSLARALPLVMADTQSLRQIMMSIVTSSIRCSRAGGQVIVSTAAGENGGAILRVRDTGRGLSETELASATGSRNGSSERGAVDFSLARALAEANRAQFQIRSTDNSGTLIEIAFANLRALAG